MFLNLNIFFPIWILIVLIYLLDMRSLQEQVKKAFCYQKLFWPFTVWINCSSDLKHFKSLSRSLEQFFLTVGQNNFGNKIPFSVLTSFIFYRMPPSVKIVSVDMSHRNLEELSLCCSPNFVTHLYLNDNRLCELPKDFFLQFNHLQWLDLRNNLLVNLPTKLPKATASQNA